MAEAEGVKVVNLRQSREKVGESCWVMHKHIAVAWTGERLNKAPPEAKIGLT